MNLKLYEVTYLWKIFGDKISVYLCEDDGNAWLVKQDVTPAGEQYYHGADPRKFIGIRIGKDCNTILGIKDHGYIDIDADTEDYLKRLGVE